MPERLERRAIDPRPGRRLTSHERMSGQTWDASYHDGRTPWDIGRPQPAVVALAASGRFAGSVLDAGCGTGENALHIASPGRQVLGFDIARAALDVARQKAATRGIAAEFVTADGLHLPWLGRRFETVLDCGLFHTFDPDERSRYATSLASVAEKGGKLYVLCFSDSGPGTGRTRSVRQSCGQLSMATTPGASNRSSRSAYLGYTYPTASPPGSQPSYACKACREQNLATRCGLILRRPPDPDAPQLELRRNGLSSPIQALLSRG